MRARGLPVSGNKPFLIERLLTGKSSKKVKSWRKSEAKQLLVSLIYSNKRGVARMSPRAIYESNESFQDYPFENFQGYLRTIKDSAKKYDEKARVSEREIWSDLTKFPRNPTTIRGYPHWDTHPANNLLEKDVKDGKADSMKPMDLRDSREEYKEFPLKVFRNHVSQEKRRQREEAGWVFRRNKKGREKHDEKINQLLDDWDKNMYRKDYEEMFELMLVPNNKD